MKSAKDSREPLGDDHPGFFNPPILHAVIADAGERSSSGHGAAAIRLVQMADFRYQCDACQGILGGNAQPIAAGRSIISSPDEICRGQSSRLTLPRERPTGHRLRHAFRATRPDNSTPEFPCHRGRFRPARSTVPTHSPPPITPSIRMEAIAVQDRSEHPLPSRRNAPRSSNV